MKYTIKKLQETPNINGMLEDGYLLARKELLRWIDEKLNDIKFTMDGDEDLEQEHINQLIGRREQLNELKEEIK